jgi:hypothetical protein
MSKRSVIVLWYKLTTSYGIVAELLKYTSKTRGSAVGIATGYELHGRGVGVRVPVWAGFFSPPCRPDRLWGPSSLLSSRYRVKRSEREAEYSIPS